MEITALDKLSLTCAACGRSYGLDELAWRCGDCGGVLDLAGFTPTLPPLSALAQRRPTLWRYAEALPIDEPADISLGEGMTPLVTAPESPEVMLKVDYLMPSGSFKDRGAVLLAALARRLGVPRMVADSSGNAGTAVAAYAARAGIPCDGVRPRRHLGGQGRAAARVRRHRPPDSRLPRRHGRRRRGGRRPSGDLLRQPRLPPVLPAGHEDVRVRAVGAAGRPAARDAGAAGRQRHPRARRLSRLP